MFKESIPCCYFPTEVVLIDDNQDFINSLSLALGRNFHSKGFVSASEALNYLKENSEFAQTLLTKYILPSEEYIPSAMSFDVKIESLYEEISSQGIRFDHPVVIIVDYAMPEMNGLEFCEALSGLPYKKIVLTGEADNDFAVEAFNFGKIERFVRKGEAGYLEKLKRYIQELNIEYFTQMSKNIADLLSKNDGSDLLRSPAFIEKFNEILSNHEIVEFYLADDVGSYILLDENSNRTELLVRTADDMNSFAEIAENDNMRSMADEIASGKKLPNLLTGKDRLKSAQTWELYDALSLQSNDVTYYYSVTKAAAPDSQIKNKSVSYHQYLYENK